MKLSRNFISANTVMCEPHAWVAAPYLRKTFSTPKKVTDAKISVSGLGFYRFWLDGEELTRGLLSPYISNPDDYICYDVYDITNKLSVGAHVFGFQLGNGFQNNPTGYVWDFQNAPFRSAPKLAVCVAFCYEDGSYEEFEADESFVWAPSPLIYDDFRTGECYDANLELTGWNLPSFDDCTWQHATRVPCNTGKSIVCGAKPIVETHRLSPVSIRENVRLTYALNDRVDEGYLYDFGENLTGLPLLRIKGERGQKVTMIFGEYKSDKGEFTVDNLRFPTPEHAGKPLCIQFDEYTCKGEGVEEWTPGFTYHGFRYALVSGITKEQATKELLTYRVMNTQLSERGAFHCSDDMLNKLQRMTRNSTLGNFLHFPNDCPHREKNGWTADAALSAEHTLLNLDPEDNYYEWMRHIRASMNDEGAIPGIIPTGGWGFAWGNGPAWDQILTTLPYYVYRYRGDKRIVEESLTTIFRYVNYLTTRVDERHLIAIGLGDWCAPFDPRSPLVFTDSVISMDICEKAAFFHDICGRTAQAKFCREIANNFRLAIRAHLIDFETMTAIGEGTPTPGCETSQAMAIYYNIFTEEEKPAAYKRLLQKIHEQNDHLDTGVLGGRVIFHVLSQNGDADLAYKIITQTDYPSFGALVLKGETTLTEDFNCSDDERITSRNHHFWGDISAWFIKSICGINYNPDATDLTHADLTPHFITALTHAEAYHETPMGKIAVSWARTGDGEVTLTVDYPEALHGTLSFDGYVCAKCGKSEIDAKSGTFVLKKA